MEDSCQSCLELYSICKDHLLRFGVFNFLAVCLAFGHFAKTRRYGFLLMTGVWAGINLFILSLLSTHIFIPDIDMLISRVLHVFFWMKINIYLDLIYSAVALILIHSSSRHTLIQDFGKAILFQGIGLFTIDTFLLYKVNEIYISLP